MKSTIFLQLLQMNKKAHTDPGIMNRHPSRKRTEDGNNNNQPQRKYSKEKQAVLCQF